MTDKERLHHMDTIETQWNGTAAKFAEARTVLRECLDGSTRLGALTMYKDAAAESDILLDGFLELRSELLRDPTIPL